MPSRSNIKIPVSIINCGDLCLVLFFETFPVLLVWAGCLELIVALCSRLFLLFIMKYIKITYAYFNIQ